MGLQNNAEIVQSLYLAYLGRAADPEGLIYWLGQLEEERASANQVKQAIANSSEATAHLALLDSDDYVRSLYHHYFEREPGSLEVNYWAERLESGNLAWDELPDCMVDAACAQDQEALRAKLSVANYYSQHVTQNDYDIKQPLALDHLQSNEELYATLGRLAEHEAITLEQVGESVEGMPLYSAVVGTGPKTLMIVTQQHGDEPLGTEAVLGLLEYLAGESAGAQTLRETMTIVVMPRVNPDGFARWQEQVAGSEGVLDPRYNSNGIELNGTYDPNQPYDPDLAPESAAVRQQVAHYRPDLFLDIHNQNTYRSEDGSLATLSIMWPTNENIDPALIEFSQRAAVAIDQALGEYDHDNLTRYPGNDVPGISRNGLGLDGTATLLLEQRGLQEMDQLAQGTELDFSALAGALTLELWIGMVGIAEAMSTGSVDTLDPLLALQIPERAEAVSFEALYGSDQLLAFAEQSPMMLEETQLLGIQQDEAWLI
ncbi:M14 family zinc carboxypeptidase [Salinicola sp. MIT1003]|uniref:DUF4214 domain-containing protein n=1 Tax=Salinicola sp. MIT1003 TaxID=1882734 RepID=UPI0008DD97A6|nr:M14 family zinc carboxypeptidase [Salinicola sp. MIT1003]OHZ01184.1 hypothetical protein BC443_12240 [Salinicola sp. MIT1003]